MIRYSDWIQSNDQIRRSLTWLWANRRFRMSLQNMSIPYEFSRREDAPPTFSTRETLKGTRRSIIQWGIEELDTYHTQGNVDQHGNVSVRGGAELQSVVGDCEGALLRPTVRTNVSHVVLHILTHLSRQVHEVCVLSQLERGAFSL